MTKFTKLATVGALTIMMTLAAAGTSQGQGIGFSFGKHRRGKHVSFGINLPLGGGHHHHPGGYYQPAPVHVHSPCCQRWIPGYEQTVMQQVFVPGATRQVWVQPVYRTDYDACGHPVQVVVQAGYYQTVQDPGYYQQVPQQTVVPGHWEVTCGF